MSFDICPGKTGQTDAAHHLHYTGKNNVRARGTSPDDRYEHRCCFCGQLKWLNYIYGESGGACVKDAVGGTTYGSN